MFRHRGKHRTLVHNLKLASLLSFVAGIVNVTGLFALQRLTTNVTGHFAYFADEMSKKNFTYAWVYLLYILAFLSGSFFSNTLVEIISKRNARFVNIIPVSIEVFILAFIAFLGQDTVETNINIIACSLLFAMGLQNALVTNISNSVVRTTHLTGLFTDLGIELSQFFFFKKPEQQKKLRSSVKLRFTIICFFFLGCIIGGLLYSQYAILTLLLGAAVLLAGLVYDSVKFKVVTLKRKYLN
ncbi:MAG: YoaK family protein [Flavisolibacter sp.]